MFQGRFSKDGKGLDFSETTRAKLKRYIKAYPNMPFEINPLLPESNKQRRFFEGAVVPLVVFYQEGMDYRNPDDCKNVREWLKIEFNGGFITIRGKMHKVARSTKNQLNQGFLERVIEWLQENYATPLDALDPKQYQHWKDAVYPNGGPETWIDYLVEVGKLKIKK